jgi:hypothetical protein
MKKAEENNAVGKNNKFVKDMFYTFPFLVNMGLWCCMGESIVIVRKWNPNYDC